MFQLRAFQKQAIEALEDPIHLIVQAPTGSGKSFIFQESTRRFGFRTILFSPLIALSRQQGERARALGIPTWVQAGGQSDPPPKKATDPVGLWILSPEILNLPRNSKMIRAINQWQPDLLVMDECHCLWEWGESFRPAFQKIPKLLFETHIPRSVWLTATLSPTAHKHLKDQLPRNQKSIGQFQLPKNLSLQELKIPLLDRIQMIHRLIQKEDSFGMIFTQTRDRSEWLWKLFSSDQLMGFYHAGMSKEERKNMEAQIRQKKTRWIIATSAFGLGMDFSHFQTCIIFECPASMTSLAQFLGRVGRGDQKGKGYFFWENQDFIRLRSLVKTQHQKEELKKTFQILNRDESFQKRIYRYFHQTMDQGQ